tara:strand:- start:1521 stop:3695 length:2175 start_codon:yes stop_codon:yes gene_type:complete
MIRNSTAKIEFLGESYLISRRGFEPVGPGPHRLLVILTGWFRLKDHKDATAVEIRNHLATDPLFGFSPRLVSGAFNPDQSRDADGKWTLGGGGSILGNDTEADDRRLGELRGDRGGRDYRRDITPLEGVPKIKGATGPDASVVAVAEQYALDNGIDLQRQDSYVRVDIDRAEKIAAAYEAMLHAPGDPEVLEAYDNLIKQTTAQYEALEKAGYEFYFFDGDGDYGSSPYNAMRELRASRRMGVYPTDVDSFGDDASAVLDNPLLRDTGIVWDGPKGKQAVTANDLFRAVHDVFGHSMEGSGFRARGEENAWQAHVKLFTGSAIGAITSETRGQNSWLNFGPHGETNRNAKVEDTIFAEQKTGLMPEWTWKSGVAPGQTQAAYNPNQSRDADGRWTSEGGGLTRKDGETAKEFRKRVIRTRPAPGKLANDPELYFDRSLATAPVVTVRVDSIKVIRAREEGIENAEKLMEAAAEGIIPRRKPLDLRLNDDGSYTVLDGNSTTAIAEKHGIEKLIGQIVERQPKAQEVANAVQGMIDRQTIEVLPDYSERLRNVSSRVQGSSVMIAPIKGITRATEKVLKKINDLALQGTPVSDIDAFTRERLADVVRGTLVIDRVSQKSVALNSISDVFGVGSLVEVDDRFLAPTSAGYSDIQTKLRVNGRLTELQINIPEMIAAKELGHPLFEESRSPTLSFEVKNSLESRQRGIYRIAKIDYKTRTGEDIESP